MTNWLINSHPSRSKNVDPITFNDEDMRDVYYSQCDNLVVRAVVAQIRLDRMLVDNRSSVLYLTVTIEEEPLATHTFMEFSMVDRRSAYHGVLGRPALKEFWAVASIHNLCMKFSAERGIATVKDNRPEARR
ncbi:Ribonuclease H [Abeliophyllum distichum]|uniref:Ribonuclease H n=1 Tax=Abeliophyllum distichum TaxID=126358 RepID=A0ABD1RED4_9LAMI